MGAGRIGGSRASPPRPPPGPLEPGAGEGDQEGESQPARAAPRGGGWASAALSQQLGSVLKQKPMSSLGVRGRSVPRAKKAMLPSRLVAQLTFPEPRTEGQRMFGSGWDVAGRGRGDRSHTTLPRSGLRLAQGRVPGVRDARCSRPSALEPRPLRCACSPGTFATSCPTAQTHQALVS